MGENEKYKTVEEIVNTLAFDTNYIGAWTGKENGKDILVLYARKPLRLSGNDVGERWSHMTKYEVENNLVVDKSSSVMSADPSLDNLAKQIEAQDIVCGKNLIEEARE